MNTDRFDVAIAGGGIVGCATAYALARRGLRVAVLEAEPELAKHQSGRNSGVVHAGLYYAPGSLKARLCAEGREALYRFCAERGLPCRRTGKLVVAAGDGELERLGELERRGRANGLDGLERLDAAGIRRREPHAVGVAGLWVPQTGVADFAAVTRELAAEVARLGGTVALGAAVRRVVPAPGELLLTTAAGALRCRRLVNCAGLQADRLARLCGARPRARIVPFRGSYFEVTGAAAGLVEGHVYPVPDPRFPFLGVHLTRTVDGRLLAGPNAALAWNRHGYEGWSPAPRDAAATLAYPGFWRLLPRVWRAAWSEARRATSRARFAAELRRLVPELREEDLEPAGCGIRAQAVDRAGRLLDDFCLERSHRALHVLNAPSPAATASLALGREIARRLQLG